MARPLDISACELLPLGEALTARREFVRARLFSGADVVAARPMLWPCPFPELEALHNADAGSFHADAYILRKVLVGGHGAQPVKDDGFLYAEPVYPGYVFEYFKQDLAADRWTFEPGRLRKRRVKRAFGLIHFNLMWGHWLTEVFPKLFAIAELRRLGFKAPIVLPSSVPDFIPPIVRELLPGQELLFFNPEAEYLAVEQLVLPPMLQQHYIFHPFLGVAIDAFTRTPGSGGERLFVSRAGMHTSYSFREMSNEAEVEALAAEMGFNVVRPEMLPFREQVSLFARARVIVGEYGSGLHNTLFSPRGAKVVSLNWITDVQSRIANFRQQDIGYVLPDDGQPRRFSLERSLQQFRIDPGELREKLTRVLDQHDAANPPEPQSARAG